MPDIGQKSFELHEFLPFLMARVGSLTALSITPQIEAAGITLQMWRVLMVLHFNGPLTLIDLSRIIGVKTSTLSRMIGRMIEKRLVSRRRSRADARTVQISLLQGGEALFQKLWPRAQKVEEVVMSAFPTADIHRMKEMLRDIETILVSQVEKAGGSRRRTKDNDTDLAPL